MSVTIETDQMIADLTVSKGNLLINEPGMAMTETYLSIQTKLSKYPLDCNEKNCRKVKNLHVCKFKDSI